MLAPCTLVNTLLIPSPIRTRHLLTHVYYQYDWNGSSVQDKRTDLAATISSVIATYVGSDQAGAWANFVDTAVGANEKRSLRDGREKLHGRKVQQHQDETLAKRARNAPTADLPRRTAAPARMS
ncbi:hypothetical protein EMMF5_001153 [Cystobasidiomycetes sp. EMM_F5]